MSTAASGRNWSIASISRSLLPVPTGMWHSPMRSNAASAAPATNGPGVVGRDDALAGRRRRRPRSCAPSRSPSCRDRLPSAGCSWACPSCRSWSRCARSRHAQRRDAHRRDCPASAVALSSAFSVSGSRAISAEAAGGAGRREPRLGQLRAVEGRALVEVGELLAIGGVVDRQLLGPRPRLDLGLEHHSGLGLVGDRLLGGGRHGEAGGLLPAPPRGARAARPCARAAESPWPSRTGSPGRASPRRWACETFIVSGLPQASATALAELARQRHVRAARAAGVRELEDALGARVERAVHGMAEARRPPAGRADGARHGARDLGRLPRRPQPAPVPPRAAGRTAPRCRG